MSNENQDLLDLCQLNQIEENAEYSPEDDQKEIQRTIDWEKRNRMSRIRNQQQKASQDVMEKHVKMNTVDEQYVGEEKEDV